MKIYKRIAALVLSMLAVILLQSVQVFAAGSIDLDRAPSMTISYQNDSMPLSGAKFDIYLVATTDNYSKLTTTEPFSHFNVNIRDENEESRRALAFTLEGYVLRDSIKPTDSGITDQNGTLSFPTGETKLTPGLYLVLGHRHSQDGWYYDASPFMMMLPELNQIVNEWDYDITANVKYDSTKIPPKPNTITRKVLKVWDDDDYKKERPQEVIVQLLRSGKVYDTVTLNVANNWRYTWNDLDSGYQWTVVEKELSDYTVSIAQEGITFVVTNTYTGDNPDEPSPTEKLPQTGQLWWPVPLLIAVGLLLIVVGVVLRRGKADGK